MDYHVVVLVVLKSTMGNIFGAFIIFTSLRNTTLWHSSTSLEVLDDHNTHAKKGD